MAAVIAAPFGSASAVCGAAAANAAYKRAIALGYCKTSALQFSRVARREASEWESAAHTALRVVIPQRATFAGNPGGR